jgi:hypothetical protein
MLMQKWGILLKPEELKKSFLKTTSDLDIASLII